MTNANCLKCKTEIVMQNEEKKITKNGMVCATGLCPNCGNGVSRMIGKADIPPVPSVPKEAKIKQIEQPQVIQPQAQQIFQPLFDEMIIDELIVDKQVIYENQVLTTKERLCSYSMLVTPSKNFFFVRSKDDFVMFTDLSLLDSKKKWQEVKKKAQKTGGKSDVLKM